MAKPHVLSQHNIRHLCYKMVMACFSKILKKYLFLIKQNMIIRNQFITATWCPAWSAGHDRFCLVHLSHRLSGIWRSFDLTPHLEYERFENWSQAIINNQKAKNDLKQLVLGIYPWRRQRRILWPNFLILFQSPKSQDLIFALFRGVFCDWLIDNMNDVRLVIT